MRVDPYPPTPRETFAGPAGQLASAIVAGLPVAVIYLLFQRKVTNAIMLSAGIKG